MAKSGKHASARALEHFLGALERVTTLDEAWRFVLSCPRGVEPGADRAKRLSHFLKHLAPLTGTPRAERDAYLALIRRFLSASAMDEPTAKRAILALREVEKADSK